jgi:hypothetical protein
MYNSRDERNKYLAEEYKHILSGHVLNVGGGGEKHLLKYLNSSIDKYIEIDISGNPDILFDLDSKESLPFEDNEFDVVICTDVLEHLENIHFMIKEMMRVSKKNIVISLPNPLSGALFSYILRGQRESNISGVDDAKMKYYGLPTEEPNDRHRWFFSYIDAQNFIRHFINIGGFRIVQESPLFAKHSLLKSIIFFMLKVVLPKHIYYNLCAQVYWVILEKDHSVQKV